ncbi:hypothetical protein SAMN04244553_3571 [Nocardia amikacinitolerans]|uniref:Uncharacterized protein n=1 Tax=Nocardia amikacinitolerans TaxID=756689 RepID=A0A285LHD2_9NOCA|nr:hypothetical protein [Nocardia amikacinitolerans]SNY83853.1 hypothetical protein SAMN04244553_3571 [Nocardia amikacinitolerans]
MSDTELFEFDIAIFDHGGCSSTTYAVSSLAAAHSTMQVHRNCRVGECVAKTSAHSVLKEAGRLTPDSGRVRT